MTLAIAAPYAGGSWDWNYQPVTNDSQKIQWEWMQRKNYLQGSASDWLPMVEGALRDIEDMCFTANWDGSGANSISGETIKVAAEIMRVLFKMLPSGGPAPDIIPEADGEISVSWIGNGGRLFSFSIGDHGIVNFAGQFGSEGSVHGWQRVDTATADSLKESLHEIARSIKRLYERNSVIIRRAS